MITIKEKIAPSWFPVKSGDPASEFLLAPLTPMAWLDVRNEVEIDEDKNFKISGRGVIGAVKDSVRDWRNVVNEKGEQIAFDRALLTELPPGTLLALAYEIVRRSILSETERKNSLSPSTSG